MEQQQSHLAHDIIKIKNFLPENLFHETLEFEKEIQAKDIGSYAGKAGPVPEELVKKILDVYESHGLKYSKLEGARVRIGTHEDINDFRSLIHVDHHCTTVLVVYLENTLYKDAETSGTLFWENNQTKKRKIDVKDNRDNFLHTLIINKHSKDLNQWTEWLRSPFEKNTALIFDSLYFHSPPSPHFEKYEVGKRVTLDIFLS